MNISRRTAIKSVGATVAAVATTPALATATHGISSDRQQDSLNVQIAHQWGKESIAAVIKNTSNTTTTITDIDSVAADYGRFDFSDLTRNGSLTLASGEEVHVPFSVMGTPVKPYGHFDNRLQKILRKSLRVSTTGKSVNVTTSLSPRII